MWVKTFNICLRETNFEKKIKKNLKKIVRKNMKNINIGYRNFKKYL